ncbi:hypothetical protein GCM10011344_18270 [Dokdonia pacifica]|uniref:Leucine Rich repeat-containing protein n=1 Tax=Dokdonia pacifica TaxID=1627892 RepID=A0A238VSX6_9FLAO|nr:leucine-rich repeat domain-containing protein [Dokdonia pacifica]GGG17979.1 hypothetical protein GCM10011344_18270 [Dokdonia pacifica]SNR37338.1 Leucine Rich repeat-containing protein [Dokdonia pacifica]
MKKYVFIASLFLMFSCNSEKLLVEKGYGLLLDFSKEKINMSKFDFENRSNEIVSLNISNNNLTEIPVFVYELENLRFLWLENNKISNISSDIVKLKKLEKIGLDNTEIKELPSNFHELKNLEYIIYLDNSLTNSQAESMLCSMPEKSAIYLIKEEASKSTYPCN